MRYSLEGSNRETREWQIEFEGRNHKLSLSLLWVGDPSSRIQHHAIIGSSCHYSQGSCRFSRRSTTMISIQHQTRNNRTKSPYLFYRNSVFCLEEFSTLVPAERMCSPTIEGYDAGQKSLTSCIVSAPQPRCNPPQPPSASVVHS